MDHISDLRNNPLLDTDSYKLSHGAQYPKGMTYAQAYLEARTGGQFPSTMFFGLQYMVERYLTQRVTEEHVWQAKGFYEQHGVPFDSEGWAAIARDLDGKIPLSVKAVPEGTVVDEGNVLMVVESTDERFPWVVGWFETMLMRVWYPTTVATLSMNIKNMMRQFYKATSDDTEMEGLPFKLHDFGSRGVSSRESAGIGGLAHLVSFMGTDTIQALVFARDYYDAGMAGFSIPAAEHSTIMAWGEQNEVDFFNHMLDTYPTGLVAVVSDTYDLWRAVQSWGSTPLRERVLERDGTLVIRPDSGDPVTIILDLLEALRDSFGFTVNSKGYSVLPDQLRIIQGDGVNHGSIYDILAAMKDAQWSIDNIAFGMGGALLQKVDRDTQRFAFKYCRIIVDGETRSISKSVATDPTKASRAGNLDLIKPEYDFVTLDRDGASPDMEVFPSELVTYFFNGKVFRRETFDMIRERAAGYTEAVS